MSFESRIFSDSELDDFQRAVFIQNKTDFILGDESSAVASFNARYDDQDPDRNLLLPEDIYFQTSSGDFTWMVGYQIFNISYMESFHPLDVINARNYDISIVNAEKIGEFSLGFKTSFYEGDFQFFLIPYPTRPILPGPDSRLNLPNDISKTRWLQKGDDEERFGNHFFMTFEKSFESFDAQLMLHKGIDRAKGLFGTKDFVALMGEGIPENNAEFFTYYPEQLMTGFGVVYNMDGYQLKASAGGHFYTEETEILTVNGLDKPDDYIEAVLGYEKSFSHGALDSTLVAEYQRVFSDQTDDFIIQNDFFVGWRLFFNDALSKEFDVGLLYDLDGNEEGFVQTSYGQRINNEFKFKIGYVHYILPDGQDVIYDRFEDVKHLYSNITYYY